MKKLTILCMAFLLTSCTSDYWEEMVVENEETKVAVVVDENYKTMYQFVEMLANSDLFGLSCPESPSYDELMHIAAPVVMTDLFGDTIGEGDCEEIYRLMLVYFEDHEPEADITSYLRYIIDNNLY